MELTAELLGAAFVSAFLIIAAIGNYIKNLKAAATALSAPASSNPVTTAIGMGWDNREQADAFLRVLTRIADAADKLADMQQTDIEKKMDGLIAQLAQTERANEARERQRGRDVRDDKENR